MATILLMSLSGSPGITTTAVALTRCWPRNAILLEADTSKSSPVLSGYLKGRYGSEKSLINLAIAATQTGRVDHNDLWAQLVPLDAEDLESATRWLLPGLMEAKSASSLDRIWGDIVSAASNFESTGIDVIIDAGRWNVNDTRSALLRAADSIIVTAHPSLPDAFAILHRLEEIQQELDRIGRSSDLQLLIIDKQAASYTASEVANSLGLDLAGALPYDASSASVFSDGAPAINQTKFNKRLYVRAVNQLATSINSAIETRRSLLLENREMEQEISS